MPACEVLFQASAANGRCTILFLQPVHIGGSRLHTSKQLTKTPAYLPLLARNAARAEQNQASFFLSRHGVVWSRADPLEAPGTPHAHRLVGFAAQRNSHVHVQVKFGQRIPSVQALSRDNVDPQLWPRPQDVFIVSYPKVRQHLRAVQIFLGCNFGHCTCSRGRPGYGSCWRT